MTDEDWAEQTIRNAAALGDDPLNIAEVALAFAALDRPRVPTARYLDMLNGLAQSTAGALSDLADNAPSVEQAARLAQALTGEHGFQGDSATYDDLQNANLMRVIDRKKGLPVALGILYIHTARGQGWQAEGINFPNHFLIRVWPGGEPVILDPFNGGRAMQAQDLRALIHDMSKGKGALTPDATTAVSDRNVLLRLQNNIKLRLLQNERFEECLEIIGRMMLLAPDQGHLVREAGMVNARIGNLRAAIGLLRDYLDNGGGGEAERHETARLLQDIESRLN